MTFPDTTYSYQSSPVDVPKFKYLTSGGWVQTLVFVGDFSLKALHDYLCNTNGILAPYDPASDPSNFGGRNHDYLAASVANELYPDVYNPTVFQPLGAATKRRSNPDLGIPLAGTLLLDPTMEGLAEYRETWLSKVSHCDNVYVSGGYPSKFIGSGMPVTEIKNAAFYKEGSYYHQYNIFLSNEGARIAQRLDSSTGLYTTPFYGNAKIEAYTFNGSAPTGYKPVYLIERATGQMIRETVSDKNGKYVLHGIPQGVEYVALSVDPKKTYNSVVEEFGVVE
ncbi:MAG: hypothetical protein RR280_04330 [Bacteroidaceae bacterium]